MQRIAEKQELRFIENLLKYTEENSYAYIYGRSLWIIMASSGFANHKILMPEHIDFLLNKQESGMSDILKTFIPGILSINHWQIIDVQPAFSALCDSRLYYKTLEFRDSTCDINPSYSLNFNGNMSDKDSYILKRFSSALDKSERAISKISKELNLDASLSYLNSYGHAFSPFSKNVSENRDIYDQLRGYIVNPVSVGKYRLSIYLKTYDPLILLRWNVKGTGKIPFFDRRYSSLVSDEFKDELYKLAIKSDEMVELARKNIFDRKEKEVMGENN